MCPHRPESWAGSRAGPPFSEMCVSGYDNVNRVFVGSIYKKERLYKDLLYLRISDIYEYMMRSLMIFCFALGILHYGLKINYNLMLTLISLLPFIPR
jgi:hypothetical protein